MLQVLTCVTPSLCGTDCHVLLHPPRKEAARSWAAAITLREIPVTMETQVSDWVSETS